MHCEQGTARPLHPFINSHLALALQPFCCMLQSPRQAHKTVMKEVRKEPGLGNCYTVDYHLDGEPAPTEKVPGPSCGVQSS